MESMTMTICENNTNVLASIFSPLTKLSQNEIHSLSKQNFSYTLSKIKLRSTL